MKYKLYKKSGFWGIDYNDVVCVPFTHRFKSSAVSELMYFLVENYIRPDHHKFFSDNSTMKEIYKLEIDLLNQINETPEYI